MVEVLFNLWIFSTVFLLSPWVKLYGTWTLGSIYAFLFLLLLISYIWKMGLYEFLKNLKEDFLKPPLIFLAVFLLIYLVSLVLNFQRIPLQIDLENAAGFKSPIIHNFVTVGFLAFSVLNLWMVRRLAGEKTLKVWLWASLLPILYGFYQVFIYDPAPHLWWDGFKRLHGTAGEGQVFGNYLLSVILLSPLVQLRIGLFLFALQFGALIITWSVGAWLGMMAGIIFIFLWIGSRLGKEILTYLLKVILIGIVVILVLFAVSPKYMSDGFKTIIYKLQSYDKLEVTQYKIYVTQFSQEDRNWLRKVALRMFEASPLIGIGPGNFGLLHNQYALDEKMKRPYIAKAHNAYLEILAETGLLGFLAFIGFLISLFWVGFRKLNLKVLALMASLLAILIQGFGFGILVHSYFWIVMGFLLADTF